MTQQHTKDELGLDKSKEVEFYAAHVEAMLESNVEKNRQLLALSSLVIGILMGFFDTDDLKGISSFIMWMIACVSFATCIIVTLIFFPKNAEYLRHVVEKSDKTETQKRHLRLEPVFKLITARFFRNFERLSGKILLLYLAYRKKFCRKTSQNLWKSEL